MPAFYYEILEIRDKKSHVHIYDNLQEAVAMGRYFAREGGREVLMRKVTDLAYLSADGAEMIAIDWRCLDAINSTY